MELRKDFTMIPISKDLRQQLLKEKVSNIKSYTTYDELINDLLKFWRRFD